MTDDQVSRPTRVVQWLVETWRLIDDETPYGLPVFILSFMLSLMLLVKLALWLFQ